MKKLLFGVAIGITAGLALMLYVDDRGEVKTTPADAALTITLSGPSDYTDPQWTSVCISNQNEAGNYTGVITVCPSDEAQGVVGACITHSVTPSSLPSSAQTIVNYMIGQWTTANPQYAP